MKAYELQKKPELKSVTLVNRERPTLTADSVRIKIRAVSLNYRDLMVARGAEKRAAPVIPTSDGAGEVVEVGSAVTAFQKGDRVVANFFPTWRNGALSDFHHAHALGGPVDGMLAEEVVLPASALLPIGQTLSFAEAACLPCAALTAWHGLFEVAALQPGATVLLQGTGGVSIFALQLAVAAGAQVIVTSSDSAKAERAKALGAMHTLDYRAQPNWGTAVKDLVPGGVDVVLDVGGPGTFDESVTALRYGGRMALIGVLTGTAGPINTMAIFSKTIQVHGIYVGSVDMFSRLLTGLATAKIRPAIDRTFPFDEAPLAYQHLASASHFGKVVIAW